MKISLLSGSSPQPWNVFVFVFVFLCLVSVKEQTGEAKGRDFFFNENTVRNYINIKNYLGINLTKYGHNVYEENCETLMEEIKEDITR